MTCTVTAESSSFRPTCCWPKQIWVRNQHRASLSCSLASDGARSPARSAHQHILIFLHLHFFFGLACLLYRLHAGLSRFKLAEEFLSLANWNVLKNPDCSNALKSQLYRLFGKLYASQGRYQDALLQLAHDVRTFFFVYVYKKSVWRVYCRCFFVMDFRRALTVCTLNLFLIFVRVLVVLSACFSSVSLCADLLLVIGDWSRTHRHCRRLLLHGVSLSAARKGRKRTRRL